MFEAIRQKFVDLEKWVLELFVGPVPVQEPDPLERAISDLMAAESYWREAVTPQEIDLGATLVVKAQVALNELFRRRG